MKRDEALSVIGFLNAGFPRETFEIETVEIWTHFLMGMDATIASNVALDFVSKNDRCPSVAVFKKEYFRVKEASFAVPLSKQLEGPREELPESVRAWCAKVGIPLEVEGDEDDTR